MVKYYLWDLEHEAKNLSNWKEYRHIAKYALKFSNVTIIGIIFHSLWLELLDLYELYLIVLLELTNPWKNGSECRYVVLFGIWQKDFKRIVVTSTLSVMIQYGARVIQIKKLWIE